MKLLLLEQNKDRKGTLLENIVKVLLKAYGYQYVTTNEIGSGGNEIDVIAEMHSPSLGGNHTHTLICECKAHEYPINMNDWLKFLGKVYKENRKNNFVTGLMIALSDANGNVKGDIRKENYENVRLLAGNELIEPITTHYRLSSVTDIENIVKKWTNLVVSDCDIAFYNNMPHWVVYFSDGTFSLLDKNGGFLLEDRLNSIISAFVALSIYSKDKYFDIRRDRIIELKEKAIKNITVWALMGKSLSYEQIIEYVRQYSGGRINVDESEIDRCLKDLSFVRIEENLVSLKSVSEINMVEFYKTILGLGIPTKLYNNFYIKHIDGSLLDEILHIHNNIVLNADERKIVLFILQHSPSALKVALYSNPLFSPKSRVIGGDMKALQESLKSTFIQTLANCLEYDADSDIAMLLFDKLDLRDFYKQTNYHIVLKDGTECTLPVSKRLYYIPFEKTEEGGVVVQASKDFIGKYDAQTGYMIGGKRKNQKEKKLFGLVKHKTGVDEEYLPIFY